MKKRSAAREFSATDLLVSPLPHLSTNSPQLFDFDLSSFNTSSSKKKSNPAPSSLIYPSSSPPQKTLTNISDLKNLAPSRSDSIKRHLDLSHSEILREFEASHSRLSKRFKNSESLKGMYNYYRAMKREREIIVLHENQIQTQACQQMMDEAENEYKKMSDRITESVEVMKASYAEFMAEAQAFFFFK